MHVIVDASNGFGQNLMVAINGSQISPKPWLNLSADAANAVLGAEDQVDVILGIGVGHEQSPPRLFGILAAVNSITPLGFGFFLLGFSRLSARHGVLSAWAILCTRLRRSAHPVSSNLVLIS